MKIVEMFKSVQGEGIFIGSPSTFLRLGKCNLNCHQCDTKWDRWKDVEPADVAARVAEAGLRHLVITGGEPTLWQDDIAALVGAMYAIKFHPHITVETNGTVPLKEVFIAMVDLFSFSPKVGSLGHDQVFKWDVVISNVMKVADDDDVSFQMKYVLDPDEKSHLEKVWRFHTQLEQKADVDPDCVFFQPLDHGTEVNVIQRILPFDPVSYARDLAKLMKVVTGAFGPRFRVLPQMHKMLMTGGGLLEEIESAKRVGQ